MDDALLTLGKSLAEFRAHTKSSINVGYVIDIYKDTLRNVLCCRFRLKHECSIYSVKWCFSIT